MSTEEENMKKMMDAMGDHAVTDEDGNVTEDEGTSFSDSSTEEAEVEAETVEEESTEGENPTDLEESESQSDNEDEETQPVEDDSRSSDSVPIDRFNQVYGEKKAVERERDELRRMIPQQEVKAKETVPPRPMPSDTNTALELELLYDKYPQFDPNSKNYSQTLDQMGAEIYTTQNGITRLEAARRALSRQDEIAKQVSTTKAVNTAAKKQASDRGVGSSASRGERSTKVNPDDMSLDEMESFMKDNQRW